MSRDYGRVNTAFWKSAAIRGLGDRGKLLANYLITNPHSNIIGAYLLPDAYIADDLDWSVETVRETLSELFKIGFAKRFSDGRHIVICKYLSWNPIENPNVAKAALKQVEQLPDDSELIHIIQGFAPYSEHFNKASQNCLEILSERLPKPFRNQEPEPEPEQKPEDSVEAKASTGAAGADVILLNPAADADLPAWWPKVDRYGRVTSEVSDKVLYDVGKIVLGDSCGGQITKLKGTKKYTYGQIVELIFEAEKKSEPKKYWAAIVRDALRDDFALTPSEKYPRHSY